MNGLLIAGLILLVVVHQWQQGKLAVVTGTETTTASALNDLWNDYRSRGGGPFQHQAELKGTTETDQPLVSEIAGQECVFYRMSVERQWEEDYWETDSRTGRRERRTRTGSDTVASNERHVAFSLRDGTGAIPVDASGAEFDAVQVASQFQPGEPGGSMLSFGGFSVSVGNILLGGGRRTLGYRFQEWVVPVGHPVYVLGMVRDVNGALRVGRPNDREGRFLISTRSEEEIVRSGRTTLTALKVGALVCFLVGVGLILGGVF